jgi:DNA-directed RNA polymerase subunit beta
MMTKYGHFIINGSARIIMNQIVRSPGVYFQKTVKEKM